MPGKTQIFQLCKVTWKEGPAYFEFFHFIRPFVNDFIFGKGSASVPSGIQIFLLYHARNILVMMMMMLVMMMMMTTTTTTTMMMMMMMMMMMRIIIIIMMN